MDAGANGAVIQVHDAIGTLTVNGSDATAAVQLPNGAGGFASASDVLAALASDGKGGTQSSLGDDGLIDFVGVAAKSFAASNFTFG